MAADRRHLWAAIERKDRLHRASEHLKNVHQTHLGRCRRPICRHSRSRSSAYQDYPLIVIGSNEMEWIHFYFVKTFDISPALKWNLLLGIRGRMTSKFAEDWGDCDAVRAAQDNDEVAIGKSTECFGLRPSPDHEPMPIIDNYLQ